MSNIKPLDLTATISKSGYQRYLTEPKSNLKFTDKLKEIGKGLLSTASSRVNQMIGVDPEYQALLEMQMEFQKQMMQVSLVSNIQRTKHETSMAAVRNLRVA